MYHWQHRLGLGLGLISLSGLLWAAPPLTAENVHLARPDIRIWNVKATSTVREGSSTSQDQGQLTVQHRSGGSSTHDVTVRTTSGTLFQDGEICHNFGTQCYCGTTTYRLESGLSQWKFAIPSHNQPVACLTGVKPTGDPDIKKTRTREEILQDAQAKRRQIQEERAARQRGE